MSEVGDAALIETVRYGYDFAETTDNFDEYFTFTNLFRFNRVAPPPFHAHGSFWKLGDLVVTAHRMGAVRAERREREMREAPADHITLMTLFDGTLDHEAETRGTARAGDLLLIDYARSFDYCTPGHSGATISITRATIESRVGPIATHGILPQSAETQLFADFLRTLVDRLPRLSQSSVLPVASIADRLMMLALGRDGESPISRNLRARAHAYLDSLQPGTIDPAQMADALGLSRSGLYRLFGGEGGVRAYDRRRRLHQLHAALLGEAKEIRLGVLGARFGFFDLSTLARQFRAQFGYNMSTLRSHLSLTRRDAAATAPLEEFRRAFAGLSRNGR